MEGASWLEQAIVSRYGTGLDVPVDVLAVGAHPDDVELAVGGMLADLARRGVRVAVVDLTDGEPTPYGTPETRRQESHEAARELGLAARLTLRLPNRYLFDTVEHRRLVAAVLRLLRPRLLLAHYWEDAHPDHWAASALADAGRFYGKLTKTDLPGEPYLVPRTLYFLASHLRLHPPVAVVVDVSGAYERKRAAIRAYRSQFEANPAGRDVPERVESRDRYYGQLIGVSYGEPLLSREPIGVADLTRLLW
ncbi:MAG TPA: bacillithiol biosynthesis deacetylase BshB1 [Limnochordales bacterium]